MKTIAVVGATGFLGEPVTRALIDAGFQVKILAREPEATWERFNRKATIISGRLQHKASLQKLLEGADALYINLSVKPNTNEKDYQPEREGLQLLLEVAKNYPLQRIAYLSSLVYRYNHTDGFRWWVFDIKAKAVELIQNCGIPYTIFYPSTFMDNLSHGSMRSGHKLLLSGEPRHGMYFIAASDFARQVANSFRLQTEGNRDYAIQGLKAYTNDEAAALFQAHYPHERLKISKVSIKLLKWLGFISPKMNYGWHIITALNNYPERFEAENTWAELGKPEITLEAFAHQAPPYQPR